MSIRSFTPDQDAQLADEYKAGATYRELAAKHGGTDVAVRSAVLRGGATPRPSYPRSGWSPKNAEEAIAMYRDGLSVKKLAARYGCRSGVITDLLTANDVVLKPGGRSHPKFRTQEACAEVAVAYAAGETLGSLGVRYNCTSPAIVRAITRGGGEVRKPGVAKRWTPEAIEWASSAYVAGASQQAIAAKMGISQTAVSRMLTKLQVIPARPRARGAAHGSWKGGRYVNGAGYTVVLGTDEDREFCVPTSGGYMLEHRLIMGRILGRPLTRRESVHHVNGVRSDNRPENLQVRQGAHGAGVVMTCNSCGSHDVQAQLIADSSGP